MKGRGALSGLAVLVTRPKAQSAGLIRGLKRLGARVIAAPAIRIAAPSSWRALDRALRGAATNDAMIFTSANAVSRFFDRARKTLGRRPARPSRLFAIGPMTAKALRARGWRGVAIPERYEGAALARRLGDVRGWRILLPRARTARDVLPRMLRRRGARVDVVETYRTVADRSGQARIRSAVSGGRADIVTFTSSSTAEHFLSAVGKARARRFFRRALAASIGPVTSATLRRGGIRRIAEAKTFTSNGLIRAILAASHGKR